MKEKEGLNRSVPVKTPTFNSGGLKNESGKVVRPNQMAKANESEAVATVSGTDLLYRLPEPINSGVKDSLPYVGIMFLANANRSVVKQQIVETAKSVVIVEQRAGRSSQC